MSLSARTTTDCQGNIIIHMRGVLDYENCHEFQLEALEMFKTKPHCKITFDLYNVDFVGSSGIGQFVELLNLIQDKFPNKLVLDNVKNEFIQVFKLYNLKNIIEFFPELAPQVRTDLPENDAGV